ncbi:GDSL-type esterase/lipase family protein [Streptacidiphilus rugosus]|uniref:GDSL-type esterase/lipase family protein n=1 Tax=Streptacidiphilus rugosus TaxID=405783 RepID=UPI00068EC621|nr:FG-GAP-like repeat-containing protein [Streptacidiphilus rugosus]
MKRLVTLTALAVAGLLALPLAPADASAPVASAPVAPAATPTSATPPQLKILPLGDSITAGYQSSTWNGYRGPLMQLVGQQTRYTVNFVGTQFSGTMADNANEGHSGYEIQGILDNVDGYLAANHPDAVLLHIGVNDLNNSDDDHATAATRAETLIDRIFTDQPGVTVIMQGLIPTTAGVPANPALPGLINTYNDQLRAWAPGEVQAGRHFTFVDAPALTPSQFADGLHPDDAGYSRMAQAFYTPLDQAFTKGWVVGGPPTPYETPTPARPARVAAGDFNGDGKLDVVGIDANNNMQFYPGNGAGAVSGPGTAMLGTTGLWANFKAIAAGDFNGDGRTDVAGIDANNNMMLYTGDGDGHLTGGTNMMPGTNGLWVNFKAVTAGDFTGTGHLGIAGIDANNNMMFYPGDGTGHLGSGTAMLGTTGLWTGFKAVTAGDFTGTGHLGIAGIDADNNLKFYPGDGTGHLGSGTAMLGTTGLWTGFHAVMAGDFTAAGKLGVAGIDADDNLKFYPGDGTGHLSGGTQMLPGNGLWVGF